MAFSTFSLRPVLNAMKPRMIELFSLSEQHSKCNQNIKCLKQTSLGFLPNIVELDTVEPQNGYLQTESIPNEL